MDEQEIKRIQREASEALLDIGVSLPLKSFRLPFRRKPVYLRITMRRPRMAGQIRIARIYLSLGVTSDQLEAFSKDEQMYFFADHAKDISRMIACTICQGPLSRRLYVRPVAWFLRECVRQEYLLAAFRKFVSLMGTDPFIPIIRSVERTNPLKLRLSQKKKGS